MREETSDNPKGGDEKSKGGSKRLLVIGLVGGLALGAGGMFAASTFLGGDGADQSAETVEEEPEEEVPLDILTVSIKRINVPLVNADRTVLGYFWIDAQFEVIGPEAQSSLTLREARLRDALIRDLHAQRTTREDRPGALDFKKVEEALRNAALSVIDAEALHRVNLLNAQPAPQ